MSLVETDWLEENLHNVKIIDCSWHMPQTNRDGFIEYQEVHISNAIFFDLDKNSKKKTQLPHMLVDKKEWEKIVSKMGIRKKDILIIYDNSDVVSSCRCWFNFIYFGHDPKLTFVLNGGLKKWIREKREVTNKIISINPSKYESFEVKELVKDKKKIDQNIDIPRFKVIDARSKERFEGKVPDPRKNVRSGSIPNSICLPFVQVINKDFSFKNVEELKNLFKNTLRNPIDNPVFSCGSGVTACVLALAYSLVNTNYLPVIYDGSWAEYGKI